MVAQRALRLRHLDIGNFFRRLRLGIDGEAVGNERVPGQMVALGRGAHRIDQRSRVVLHHRVAGQSVAAIARAA